MQGTVKFFHENRGWGFITSGNKDYFVHYSKIDMPGRKLLLPDDIVDFKVSDPDENGRVQAVNVQPILTMQMIKDSLKEENLFVKIVKADENTLTLNTLGMKKGYMVVDENDVIQAGENGMTFLELAAFSGYDTEDLSV